MHRLKTLSPLFLIVAVLLSCGLGEKAEQIKDLAESVEKAQKQLEEGDSANALRYRL